MEIILYLDIDEYRELAKAVILKYINSYIDLEFPLIRIISKEYIKLGDDKQFLQEIVDSKVNKRIDIMLGSVREISRKLMER